MSRGTGVFQQREFLEKLRRLEDEVASAKAAADAMVSRAQERASQAGASGTGLPGAQTPSDTKTESEPKV